MGVQSGERVNERASIGRRMAEWFMEELVGEHYEVLGKKKSGPSRWQQMNTGPGVRGSISINGTKYRKGR